jgi:hypothetical protein
LAFLLLVAALAACDRRAEDGPPAGKPDGLRLDVYPVPEGETVVVDGTMADKAWTRAVEVVVPLERASGSGPAEVRLRALYDNQRIYLLAVWPDPVKSYGRFWRRTGVVEFERHETEDAFAVCWAPNSLREQFREQGCALFCHDGKHAYPEAETGQADFWFWGAQQHYLHRQARDMRLPFGPRDRLRGDSQPEDSDNLPNLSLEYEGPRYYPTIIRSGVARILGTDNVQQVTKKILLERIPSKQNFGREIPLDIQRARKGSRGDVAAGARHHEGKSWVLELARDLETGHPDDLPLVPDPLVSYLFAVAINDDSAGGDHTATSGPIELSFLPPR